MSRLKFIYSLDVSQNVNECAPLVNREIRRPSAPWIDANLQDFMRERNNIHMCLKKDGYNVNLQDKYKVKKKKKKSKNAAS